MNRLSQLKKVIHNRQTADEEEDTGVSIEGQPWGGFKPVQTNTLTGSKIQSVRKSLQNRIFSLQNRRIAGQVDIPPQVKELQSKVYNFRVMLRTKARKYVPSVPDPKPVAGSPPNTTYRTRQHSLPLDH